MTLVTEVTVTMGECVDGVGGPRPGQSREELRLADKLDRTLLTNTGDPSYVLQHGFIASPWLVIIDVM